MIMNDAIRTLLSASPADEILVANQEEYYNGAPVDVHGNSKLYKEVVDIIKENGKLIILTR